MTLLKVWVACSFAAWLLVGVLIRPAGAQENAGPIVINEIHFKPDPVTESVEFVELTNITPYPVDLSDWMLDGGIRYFFPKGTVLLPYATYVVAHNSPHFSAKYGFLPDGEFQGILSNEGETLTLRNWQAESVDEVEYRLGFPWPIVGPPPGNSIQLLNPRLDNTAPGTWRSAPPTPGRQNAVYTNNAPPLIDHVSHRPAAPTSQDDVIVTARIHDSDGVAAATLLYQLVEPGAYIALSDTRYVTDWTPLEMIERDDGTWEAVLPAAFNRHRHLVRYRIEAVDGTGQRQRVPYADDPQPNFAYFVYDSVPSWSGSITGEGAERAPFDFSAMHPIAVYHVLAKQRDVADAMFVPPSERREGYFGSDYLWTGTLVHAGVVYDHVGFRARGAWARFTTGKTWWKFNFLPGHRFQAYDDYGRPAPVKWDKLNLNGTMQRISRRSRGEQGMFESVGFRIFSLAGLETPLTHFVHLRVIDSADEQGRTQYDGDFWGLYLAIENPDGRFLDTHDLPDGNLYKSKGWGVLDKENQGRTATTGVEDLTAFLQRVKGAAPEPAWWEANFDLERYYRYRSVVDSIRHYDIHEDKNIYLYFHPDTGQTAVLPWDIDYTWFREHDEVKPDAFWPALWSHEPFRIELQNHLRELQDLLFNRGQMQLLLEEYARLIDTPEPGLSMVDADRAFWDYNPILESRYVDEDYSRPGEFYRSVPGRSFRGILEHMLLFLDERVAWSEEALLADPTIPETPQIAYLGPERFPADELIFGVGDYHSPNDAHPFAAVAWRIAEVSNPEGPVFDPAAPWIHEIETVYSRVFDEEVARWTVPPGTVKPWHTYRVRARMQDSSGRWSRWSAPVQLIARPPIGPLPPLVISEIHYHPAPAGPQDGDNFEFVELFNTGDRPINMTNVRLDGAVDYRFAPDTVFQPGERLVLVSNQTAFDEFYGLTAYDEYERRLGNGGDELRLLDGFGRLLVTVAYDDRAPWPESPDGDGPSLVLKASDLDPASERSWRTSLASGGTPGHAALQPVVINEVALMPQLTIELYNVGDASVDVGNWVITDERGEPARYRITGRHVIAPGGYHVLTGDQLVTADGSAARFAHFSHGGELYLTARLGTRLLDYSHGFRFNALPLKTSLGRYVDSAGREMLVAQQQPTLGAVNGRPQESTVVISEIGYNPLQGADYIRITNVSSMPVKLFDAADPGRTYRIDGLYYELPPGLELAAGESVVVSGDSPVDHCLNRTGSVDRVVGPYPVRISTKGQSVRLLAPAENGFLEVDRVDYQSRSPWPETAQGTIYRVTSSLPGSEPQFWASAPSATAPERPDEDLCAFHAKRGDESNHIDFTWATVRGYAGFQIWSSSSPVRATASELGARVDGEQPDGSVRIHQIRYTSPEHHRYFWLEAVDAAGATIPLGTTELERPYFALYLPLVQ